GGGRRRDHAVCGGLPGRRLSPARCQHAAAFRHRIRRGRALARLFLARRTEPKPMTLAHDRTSDFLEGGRRERRQIVTPEGVPLSVELADYGERMIAFVIDLVIWFLLILAILIPLISAIGVGGGSLIAISIALFVAFL